jgi:hypothetical protein
MISDWALSCFNNYVDKEKIPDGEHTFLFIEDNPPIYTTIRRIRARATRVMFWPTYVLSREFIPLDFRSYFDRAKLQSISDAAVAKVEVGGTPASLVLSKDATGEIKVSVVPAPVMSTIPELVLSKDATGAINVSMAPVSTKPPKPE